MKYLKIIGISVIMYILACLVTYFSMIAYSDNPSSSCLSCSYKKDVLGFSIYLIVVFFLLLIFLRKIPKRNKIFSIILTVIFIVLVFLNNYNIFVDRVASWSSYTTEEEFISVLSSSYLYFIIGSIVVFFILYKSHDFLSDNVVVVGG